MCERWLPVPGYESRYEVSDYGNVRSLDRVWLSGYFQHGKALRQHVKGHGYLTVRLYHDTQPPKRWMVHRLVLSAFVGQCPVGMEGCHNDGNPANNHLSNLRWDTRIENIRDIARHGRQPNLNKTHCKNGHPFDEANTAINSSNGQRCCRICRRRWRREQKQRAKELRNVG